MLRRLVANVLMICIVGLGLPLPASAGMIPTTAALAGDRDAVNAMLERAEVRAELARHGVEPADVKARVAALTDAEVAGLARQVESLPAGADGLGAVVGAIVFVFLVLLITDLLGLTKVFPFTRSIR